MQIEEAFHRTKHTHRCCALYAWYAPSPPPPCIPPLRDGARVRAKSRARLALHACTLHKRLYARETFRSIFRTRSAHTPPMLSICMLYAARNAQRFLFAPPCSARKIAPFILLCCLVHMVYAGWVGRVDCRIVPGLCSPDVRHSSTPVRRCFMLCYTHIETIPRWFLRN